MSRSVKQKTRKGYRTSTAQRAGSGDTTMGGGPDKYDGASRKSSNPPPEPKAGRSSGTVVPAH